jgi:hypothetical protein
MRHMPPNFGSPRHPAKMRAGARSRAADQPGVEVKMNCLVCGKVPSISHRLKISAKASPWTVRLCPACDRQVTPLSPVTELLWFQARGIDVLALASAQLCKSGKLR